MKTDEYLKGQAACKAGKESPKGASADFERGFSKQYEWEQLMTEVSGGNKHN